MSPSPTGVDRPDDLVAPDPAALAGFLSTVVDPGRPDGAGAPAGLDAAIEDVDRAAPGRGRPVLVALPNGAALLTTVFALLLAGCAPVPISPAAGSGRLRAVADRLGAAAVVAPRIDPARYGARTVHRLGEARLVLLDGAATHGPGPFRPGELVLMTSGTSGIASGCVHGIGALLRNAARHASSVGQRRDDTVLVTLPLHYSYAFVAQAMAAFALGSRLVLAGPPFAPPAYDALLRGHEVTVSALTPSLLPVLRDAHWRPPPSLRVLGVGGGAADPDDVGALLAASPGLELYLTYGLTEAGPRVATLPAHAVPRERWTSLGTPLPGVRTGLRPAAGGGQELVVESDTVLRRRVPGDRPDPRVAPSAVATGDLARRDGDGHLHLCGRLGDSLVVGGEKVWLPSVRELATTVPGVRRATTRAHPGPRPGGYDLDVYVDEPGREIGSRIEDALRRVLLRAERPHRITLHRATDSGWHK